MKALRCAEMSPGRNEVRALKTLYVLCTSIDKLREQLEISLIGKQAAESQLADCKSKLAASQVPQASL